MGVTLKLNNDTLWRNVPDAEKVEIERSGLA
jgi:hypothetical protein